MLRYGARSLLVAAVIAGFWGCSGGGVGSDECRQIEDARCSAAQYCDVGLTSASLVTECNHFSRDNCLHGLASGQTPVPNDLKRCVAAINAAGTCARRARGDILAVNCDALVGPFLSLRTTVCDVVEDPEDTGDCAFLAETPVTATEDAGSKDAGTD